MGGIRTETGVLIPDPQPRGNNGNQRAIWDVVGTMSILSRALLLVGLVALLAACTGAASSPGNPGASESSGGPEPSESPKPATGAIEHATGATDVILRLDQGGGMLRGGGATLVPPFTLYGDGTVVFRNPALEPPPAVGPVMVGNPMRTAKLDEDQIQDLLDFALTEGGLGVAKLQYDYPMLADAGTAIFTIRAGGLDKTVNVYALGLDDPNISGPAGTGRIREAVRAADELRPERHVRDGCLRPERIPRDPDGHRRLPRRGAHRVAVGRHRARRLQRAMRQPACFRPGS